MTRRWLGMMVAVLLLAAAVRVLGTADERLWSDEGWTTWLVREHSLTEIIMPLAADHHPPLYFVALKLWSGVAGESRFALRFAEVAAGVLSAAVVYRIGADWLGTGRVGSRHEAGIYAALWFAVVDFVVIYSTTIRHYGWLVLLALLATLLFLRYLRADLNPRGNPGALRWRIVLLYALVVALLLYTLYLGVLVLAVHGLIWLLWHGDWRQKAGLLISWALAALLYLPWLPVVVQEQFSELAGGIQNFPGTYATTPENVLLLLGWMLGDSAALLLALLALAVTGLHWSRGARGMAQLTLLLCGAGIFALLVAFNARFGLLAPRTIVLAVPFVLLLAGAGLARIEPRSVRWLLAGSVALVALVQAPPVQPRLNTDSAAQAAAAFSAPGDLLVIETGFDDPIFALELEHTLPYAAQIDILYPLYNPDPQRTLNAVPAARRVTVVNWFVPSQTIALLEAQAYTRAETAELPVTPEYLLLFPQNPLMQVVTYVRRDPQAQAFVFGGVFMLDDAYLSSTVQRGADLIVDLWWSAAQPIEDELSTGLILQDPGGVTLVEAHGQPGGLATTQWQVGEIMFERRRLSIPADAVPGDYRLIVNAYPWRNPQPLTLADGLPYAQVAAVLVTE